MVAVHLTLADEPLQNRMKKAETSYQSDLAIVMRMIPTTQHVFCAVLGKTKGKPGGPYADVHQITDGQFTVNESDN